MAYRSYLRHALVAAGVMLVVGACVDTPSGSDSAVAPTAGPNLGRVRTTEETQLIVPVTVDPLARYIKVPHAQDYWIKQWIGPQGGIVDFLGFRIIVPAGAVDRVTKFEIRIPGENSPGGQERVYAEFGPHNVTFKVPLIVELPYANTDAYGSPGGVLWYNERTRIWERMGGGITADGQRVYVETTHFSLLGAEGGGTASGAGGRTTTY
jgi:hypothetical protein